MRVAIFLGLIIVSIAINPELNLGVRIHSFIEVIFWVMAAMDIFEFFENLKKK